MQLFNSAALAIIATFAQQALADCQPGHVPFTAAAMYSCHPKQVGDKIIYDCPPSGAIVTEDQLSFTLQTTSSSASITASCVGYADIFVQIHCTPNSRGTVQLPHCPSKEVSVENIVPQNSDGSTYIDAYALVATPTPTYVIPQAFKLADQSQTLCLQVTLKIGNANGLLI
ncbi:hypothetical protein E4U55_001577 [Claviceps digitariae]|nr:hypothetical protein E4U55_001577 [Claviceps digitariae]